MFLFFSKMSPVYQALLAGIFTFTITALGSGVVVFFKKMNKNIMDGMLSSSAGIMIAASFFSLLNPAVDIAFKYRLNVPIVIVSGFLLGGLILWIGDYFFSSLDKNNNINNIKSCLMLFISITLHNPILSSKNNCYDSGKIIINIQNYNLDNATLVSALTLTLAIAIQNFPEGSAISLPFRRAGITRWKSFLIGSLSAIVEPVFALIGALLVLKVRYLLPFILSFTAGAMIFVCTMELIPESQKNDNNDLMAFVLLLGFSIMMILEIVLG